MRGGVWWKSAAWSRFLNEQDKGVHHLLEVSFILTNVFHEVILHGERVNPRPCQISSSLGEVNSVGQGTVSRAVPGTPRSHGDGLFPWGWPGFPVLQLCRCLRGSCCAASSRVWPRISKTPLGRGRCRWAPLHLLVSG